MKKNNTDILSGEKLIDAIKSIKRYKVECLLLNCNTLERTIRGGEIISENWKERWGVYPNLGVGEPSPDGIITDYNSNEAFIDSIKIVIDFGATILGGCCCTRPIHIKQIRELLILGI